MTAIDLNADLGEGDAYDHELLRIVSSCNIACGGHVGDSASMAGTVRAALANDVAIGAHPSYPDREGFGRRSHFCAGDALRASLAEQIESLRVIAAAEGGSLRHVKPHGALYNDAAIDRALADLIVDVVVVAPGAPVLVGPPASELQIAADDRGLAFIGEGFVDRVYRADGTLVPRSEPVAVHTEINVITAQAVSLATRGRVVCQSGEEIEVAAETLCIHGDTESADVVARAVRDVLEANGVRVRGVG